jgi:hypothetical protein
MVHDARPPVPVSRPRQIGYGTPYPSVLAPVSRSGHHGETSQPPHGAAHRLADGETCGSAATPNVH